MHILLTKHFFQLMVVILTGQIGHHVAGHVVQASFPGTVHATTQYHHPVVKTAPMKDHLLNKDHAVWYHVQEVVTGQPGPNGHHVPGHAVVESSLEADNASLLVECNFVLGRELSLVSATASTVQVCSKVAG